MPVFLQTLTLPSLTKILSKESNFFLFAKWHFLYKSDLLISLACSIMSDVFFKKIYLSLSSSAFLHNFSISFSTFIIIFSSFNLKSKHSQSKFYFASLLFAK